MNIKFLTNLKFVIYLFFFLLIFYFLANIFKTTNEDTSIISPMPTKIADKRWKIRSVDTMKYSRDPSREKINDKTFDKVIDTHIAEIASMSANFVAIGTPYDDEFRPILKRWVDAARRHNLHVWFRGNHSGWEGWFGYPRIDRETHIVKTREFILKNSDLFQDGDIFTSCPECENGKKIEWGDPKSLAEHRDFLIKEHNAALEAFVEIGKNVESGYYSMNGDLARVLMDENTTRALGGVVVVDHYVSTTDKLADDIRDYARRSGGKVILGEFGAPIPDLHGNMSDQEQADWINDAFSKLSGIPELIGVNYWVSHGGSTALFDKEGRRKPSVSVLSDYYSRKFK